MTTNVAPSPENGTHVINGRYTVLLVRRPTLTLWQVCFLRTEWHGYYQAMSESGSHQRMLNQIHGLDIVTVAARFYEAQMFKTK
jgi:hypothetical protein